MLSWTSAVHLQPDIRHVLSRSNDSTESTSTLFHSPTHHHHIQVRRQSNTAQNLLPHLPGQLACPCNQHANSIDINVGKYSQIFTDNKAANDEYYFLIILNTLKAIYSVPKLCSSLISKVTGIKCNVKG